MNQVLSSVPGTEYALKKNGIFFSYFTEVSRLGEHSPKLSTTFPNPEIKSLNYMGMLPDAY